MLGGSMNWKEAIMFGVWMVILKIVNRDLRYLIEYGEEE